MAAETVADVALDQALARIGELTARLWAVRAAHRPGTGSRWRRTPRCRGCRQVFPCPTARLSGGAR